MKIRVLTYNVSWATQINKIAGSEADFVEQCKKTYKNGGKDCIKNAIKNISKLKPLDLVCLQEVNSPIEGKIMKIQPNLKKYKRGTIGISTISTLWNPTIFGNPIYDVTVNLTNDKNDFRPCLIILFKNENDYFIVLNVHAPWNYKKTIPITTKNIKQAINSNSLLKNVFFSNNAKIIACGDFNDANTVLSRDKPLIIKDKNHSVKLKYKKGREETRKTLKSCCWHDKRNKYGYFTDTGDYILVNKNIKQESIKIPEIFKKKGPLNRLFSDHAPVESVILI